MRLPKTVTINSRLWSVVTDRKKTHSHFSYEDRIIAVGARKPHTRGDILRAFLHEVAEISSVERGIRFTRDKELGGNGDYMFCADHDQFDYMISDVSDVIRNLLKD